VSLPVVAEAAVRLGSVLGVGVQAFANLNKKQSFGGVVVFVQLGWLP
jgi:plasmid maintenance system antidote protein VapI